MSASQLDTIDKRILRLVQKDASLPIGVIADRVGLSSTPCWKRLKKLEQRGIIKSHVALLDPSKLGLGLTAFVMLEVEDKGANHIAHFIKQITQMEEVMDCYRMAGGGDFMIRVLVPDTAAFDAFYKHLVELIPMKSVTSRFASESIKTETAVPLGC